MFYHQNVSTDQPIASKKKITLYVDVLKVTLDISSFSAVKLNYVQLPKTTLYLTIIFNKNKHERDRKCFHKK